MKVRALNDLFTRYGVKIVYLMGSQKETGMSFLFGQSAGIEKGSDLDIGVVFENLPQDRIGVYGELYADLSILFEPFRIDLIFLQETNALFQYEAIKGELVYFEDELFLDNYEEGVMKRADDLSYKRIEFEKDFFEVVRDGYFEIEHR